MLRECSCILPIHVLKKRNPQENEESGDVAVRKQMAAVAKNLAVQCVAEGAFKQDILNVGSNVGSKPDRLC